MKPYAPSRRQGLAELYAPRVKRLAQQVASRMSANVSDEDLFQEGMIGVLDAIERHQPVSDPSRDAYVLMRARGAMFDACRRMDILPRHQRDKADEVKKTHHRLTQALGRPPTAGEIAQALDLPLADYHSLRQSFLEFAAFEDLVEIDGLVDEQADPMQSVALREFMQKVAQLIPQLPRNQQLVLALHYQEEWSYSEIADSLQLTRGRISQLHTAAIQTLRSLMLEQDRPASGPKPLA